MLTARDIDILRQFRNYCQNTQGNLIDFFVFEDENSRPQPFDHYGIQPAESIFFSHQNIDLERQGNRYTLSQDGVEKAFHHKLIPLLFHFYGVACMEKFNRNIEMEDQPDEMTPDEDDEWYENE